MIYLNVSPQVASYNFLKRYINVIFYDILKEIVYTKKLINSNIDSFLKINYNISLNQFISILSNNVKVTKTKNLSIIFIEDNVKIGNHRLKDIISLVNYGNRTIKGYLLINDAMSYLKRNLYYLPFYYKPIY